MKSLQELLARGLAAIEAEGPARPGRMPVFKFSVQGSRETVSVDPAAGRVETHAGSNLTCDLEIKMTSEALELLLEGTCDFKECLSLGLVSLVGERVPALPPLCLKLMGVDDPLRPPGGMYATLAEEDFDRLHGVDTMRPKSREELRYDAPDVDYSPYDTVPARHIDNAIRAVEIDHSAYTFIDVGCGKGKVLFVASRYPFIRCVGIELDQELCDIARRNRDSLTGIDQRSPIEVLEMNALEYRFPSTDLVIYLWEPFGATTLRSFMARLRSQVRAHEVDCIVLSCGISPVLSYELAWLRPEQVVKFKEGRRWDITVLRLTY